MPCAKCGLGSLGLGIWLAPCVGPGVYFPPLQRLSSGRPGSGWRLLPNVRLIREPQSGVIGQRGQPTHLCSTASLMAHTPLPFFRATSLNGFLGASLYGYPIRVDSVSHDDTAALPVEEFERLEGSSKGGAALMPRRSERTHPKREEGSRFLGLLLRSSSLNVGQQH